MDQVNETPSMQTPAEHLMVRKKSEIPWQDMTFAKAKKFLEDRGFVLLPDHTQQFQTAQVYHFTNPHTTQRANLSHKSKDKRGNPIDEAKLNFHLVTQPKRRTSEQKYRDNYVQYD